MSLIDLEESVFKQLVSTLKPVKGFSTVVELNPETFQEVRRVDFTCWHKRRSFISDLVVADIPYALVCHLREESHFLYDGKILYREVELTSGLTSHFFLKKQEPLDVEKLKQELRMLAEMLDLGVK